MYVADYSHGLLRLDLATGDVTRLQDAPHSTSLGIDGIVLHQNTIIGIQNGVAPARVMRYRLNPAGTAITHAEMIDRNSAIADEPTIGTIANGEFVYVANSQWEKHDGNGVLRAGTTLAKPVLLGIPLSK